MKYEEINKNSFISSIMNKNPMLDKTLVVRAFDFALEAHAGQARNSGEDFILHPLNVSTILASMKLDTATVCGGILHDILEDTKITYSELKQSFGSEIADLVDGVTKMQRYNYTASISREEEQAENFRKLLISTSKDIRVILIKLADRLHNMRTLQFMPEIKQVRIAQETLDIYAPLANRFGIARIKWELEDLALKFLDQSEYQAIISMVSQKKDDREKFITQVINPLKEALFEAHIAADISGRSKHFYSIYRKKKVRKIPYDEIYDLAAIRIIVDSVEHCYSALGIVHSVYEPLERFSDYIARPKPNGYQSLHTIVIGPQKKKVEVQIRTTQMHLIAEEGIAAHWQYKEFKNYSESTYKKEAKRAELQNSFKEQLNWIRKLLKQQQDGETDFIEQLKLDLYPEIIIVISPKGDFIKLPKGSTPLDFAFAIHSDVGLRCTGAKINGRIATFRTPLHSGDIVDITTTSKPNPSKDWLDYMKSSRAKQRLRAYLRKKELEDSIILGQEIFIKKCRKHHLKMRSEEEIIEVARLFKMNSVSLFFASIGKGDILFSHVLEQLKPDISDFPAEKEEILTSEHETARQMIKGIRIQDIDNLMITYARCCNPVPGDRIIAYTTRGRGITIHQEECHEANFLRLLKEEPERFIPVIWDYEDKISEKLYPVSLEVVGEKKPDLLLDILKKFNRFHLELDDAQMTSSEEKRIGRFSFKTRNKVELNLLIKEILNIDGVDYVNRGKQDFPD